MEIKKKKKKKLWAWGTFNDFYFSNKKQGIILVRMWEKKQKIVADRPNAVIVDDKLSVLRPL